MNIVMRGYRTTSGRIQHRVEMPVVDARIRLLTEPTCYQDTFISHKIDMNFMRENHRLLTEELRGNWND